MTFGVTISSLGAMVSFTGGSLGTGVAVATELRTLAGLVLGSWVFNAGRELTVSK